MTTAWNIAVIVGAGFVFSALIPIMVRLFAAQNWRWWAAAVLCIVQYGVIEANIDRIDNDPSVHTYLGTCIVLGGTFVVIRAIRRR